jgi:hypothetical protein
MGIFINYKLNFINTFLLTTLFQTKIPTFILYHLHNQLCSYINPEEEEEVHNLKNLVREVQWINSNTPLYSWDISPKMGERFTHRSE